MIINNTYFKNDIYVPKAKPSIVKDITALSSDLLTFIDEKEIECLIKCLGLPLYKLLANEFDFTQNNLLKAGSDQKWDNLLNGVESYINSKGQEVSWNGIRFKSRMFQEEAVYDKSFLAYYVYWYFEEDNDIMEYVGGTQKALAKNADTVSSRPKVVKAWNNFVNLVQGHGSHISLYKGSIGLGVDYYGNTDNEATSFYKFIRDSNETVVDTYPGFNPTKWFHKNSFDI